MFTRSSGGPSETALDLIDEAGAGARVRGLAGRDEAVAGRVDILDIARVASKKTGVPVEVLLQA